MSYCYTLRKYLPASTKTMGCSRQYYT